MANKPKWQFLKKSVSYILVAVLSASVAFAIAGYDPPSKLDVLQQILVKRYIGETDETALEDAAADAMVEALGDRWSYYIPAAEYKSFEENRENSYVGIGITIQQNADGLGYDIVQVEPSGPAKEEGVLPGDVLIRVEETSAAGIDLTELKSLIQGNAGTKVTITVLRDGQEISFELTRRKIKEIVASGELLDGDIGLVTIKNFNENCSTQTISVIQELQEQGARALVFDVRNNGGGYLEELIKLLDYLLPEGVLFQSVNYKGEEKIDRSDADCLEMPMVVLINGNTYSAAEFFAAALEEYDWAVTVGQQTSGKGYFQTAILLADGSAVNLSVGKYLTPKGVNLQEQGGLTPQIPVDIDEEMAAKIYSGLLSPMEDPQILAAVKALQ